MESKYMTMEEEVSEYILWCLEKLWAMPVINDEERNTYCG